MSFGGNSNMMDNLKATKYVLEEEMMKPGLNKLFSLFSVLTLRLLTHLKEYLHFLDFHLPLPQLFLPGALAVLVGVSGRSALVPLSTLAASSYKCTKRYR